MESYLESLTLIARDMYPKMQEFQGFFFFEISRHVLDVIRQGTVLEMQILSNASHAFRLLKVPKPHTLSNQTNCNTFEMIKQD